jgi:YesN/AraC family two-component response regulator
MSKTTVLQKINKQFRFNDNFPKVPSLFSSGYSSLLKELPQQVIVWITAKDKKIYPSRVHHRYNLVFVLSESLYAISDGLRFNLSLNEGLLIFPTQCHHFEYPEIGEVATKVHFTFELNDPAIKTLRNKVLLLDKEDQDILLKILQNIYSQDDLSKKSDIPCLLGQILNHLLSKNQHYCEPQQCANNTLLKTLSYIKDHYTENINIKTVGAAIGLSPSRIAAVFRKETQGITINTYISKLRYFHAIELLNNTDMTIGEIAVASGFNDQFSFSRRFKQLNEQNLSPKAYREIVRQRGLSGWKH